MRSNARWGASFSVKASQITDLMSIRLRNITVYEMFFKYENRYRYLTGKATYVNKGINIIPIRTETF